MDKIEQLEHLVAKIADRIARMEAYAEEPEVGSVISLQVKHRNSEHLYEYIFFRAANGRWYSTDVHSGKGKWLPGNVLDSRSHRSASWSDIVEWLTSPKVTVVSAHYATGWEEIPEWEQEDPSDSGDEDETATAWMGTYGGLTYDDYDD